MVPEPFDIIENGLLVRHIPDAAIPDVTTHLNVLVTLDQGVGRQTDVCGQVLRDILDQGRCLRFELATHFGHRLTAFPEGESHSEAGRSTRKDGDDDTDVLHDEDLLISNKADLGFEECAQQTVSKVELGRSKLVGRG